MDTNPFEKITSLNPTSRVIQRPVFLTRNNGKERARNVLETDYKALRGICTDLPQRGRVSRSEIIKAVLTKVQLLESEVDRERAKDRASCHLQHARPPETARVVRSKACTLTGRCKTHPDMRMEQTVQTWGGGFTAPEVQVLWDSEQPGVSQHRMPGHHPPSGPRSARPYLPPSPPLPRRLWRPMMRSPARPRSPAPFWRPFHDSTRPVQTAPERIWHRPRDDTRFHPRNDIRFQPRDGTRILPRYNPRDVTRVRPRVKPRGDPEDNTRTQQRVRPRDFPRVDTSVDWKPATLLPRQNRTDQKGANIHSNLNNHRTCVTSPNIDRDSVLTVLKENSIPTNSQN